MAKTLATYITFPGHTADAFKHWHEVFGGELNILTYADNPMEGMPFEPNPEDVAHVTLDLPGGHLAGGDSVGDEREYPTKHTAYSLLYMFDSVDEAKAAVQKMIDAGGEINMPFEEAPWGDWYGQVFDRFGVMWAFNVPAAS